MEVIHISEEKIYKICRQNDVEMLGVFGSVAKGLDTEDSDIDLLVRFSSRKGLLQMIRLERLLSEAIGKRVDLLTEGAISPYLRDDIMNDLQVIYGTP